MYTRLAADTPPTHSTMGDSFGHELRPIVTLPTAPTHTGSFGAALAGQYEIEREIGRGGMGIVYLARDVRLDRRVAIKTLPEHLANDPMVRERFLREARTAGALSHQNIVPIHRADEIAGHVFFVMGFVDGQSMAQRIRERGRLDPLEVVRELHDVANALGYAHQHGVVHRDVKTENILIDASTGRAMVTDFGIARLAESTPLTSTGQLLGTVYYLSPEQVSGDKVDARSDIYSLGVVGYFALSGRFPFDADLASAVLIAHVTKAPPPLLSAAPDVPGELADIIDRCLAKDPAARFRDCREMAERLAAVERQIEATPNRNSTPSAGPQPKLLSDTEAQSIWQRAADLQSLTGAQPRPEPIIATRDPERDAARTSGYKLADVRDAAVEAGIPAKFVEVALAEHGLPSSPGGALPVPTAVDRGSSESLFTGGRHKLQYEIVVDGEMPEDDYDLLIDIIRRGTGHTGTLATVGRSLSWHTHANGRDVQVSVLPRGGKTAIRVSDNLTQVAGGIFAGLMGGFGGAGGAIWMGIGAKMHNPMFGLAMWVGTAALSYAGARVWFSVGTRRRDRELKSLAEEIAAQATESIAAARRKFGPGPRG
jgi:serine/threonine-protein kinase